MKIIAVLLLSLSFAQANIICESNSNDFNGLAVINSIDTEEISVDLAVMNKRVMTTKSLKTYILEANGIENGILMGIYENNMIISSSDEGIFMSFEDQYYTCKKAK